MIKQPLSQTQQLNDETRRRSTLILQTLMVLLIPVFVSLVTGIILRFSVTVPPAPQDGHEGPFGGPLIPIVVLVIFFSALIMLVRLGRTTISALILIGTWTLVTTLFSLRGGVTTYFPALLILPICAAGLLLDGVASVSLAALATLLVASVAWLETQGLIETPPLMPSFVMANLPFLSIGFWTGLFWSVAALTSLLAGGLQRALAQSRTQAQTLGQLSAELEARVEAQTAELAQRARRAEALYDVSRALTSTLDLSEVLALITEQAARLLGFESSLVLLAQPDGTTFTLVGAYNPPTARDLPLIDRDYTFHQVLEQRKPAIIPITAPVSGGTAAALVLPMQYGTKITGVLVLSDERSGGARSGDDMALAAGLADQAAVAIANAQLLAQARAAATLEERTRLARDIHDTLAQGLTGIVVQLGAAQRALIAAPDAAGEHLDLAQRLARESLSEARRSVWNLRAPALERGTLADALEGLAARANTSTTISFKQCGEPWLLQPRVESELLRVGQEALVNVAKHAQASHAAIVLEYMSDTVSLSVRDNGIGFDEQTLHKRTAPAGPWGSFGLLGMRERIAALGGMLELSNNGGAQVVATVPRARDELTG